MQLLTNTKYSLSYQCYSDSEENSWSGTVDFELDRDYEDLMAWFKSERTDIFESLKEHNKQNGKDPDLEQFWFILTTADEMIAWCEKQTKEDIYNLLSDVPDEEAQHVIKLAAITNNPQGFVQWHKHPKRMSEHGRETLKRLTSDDGLYSLMGVADEVSQDKSDYNTWAFESKKKQTA